MQFLASGKVGSQRYANRDLAKPVPALDMIEIAQQSQRALEETQGYSLSNEEGSADSQNNDLSIIGAGDVGDYDDSLAKLIQTYVANNSYLDVDPSSTANNIVLVPRKIADIDSPDGTNYAKATSLPFNFRDNLSFTFRATITNTSAVTISIPALPGLSGSIEALDEDGAALSENSIIANKFYTISTITISTVKKVILHQKSSIPLSGRNAIINGDFNIWQRGVSFVGIADGSYSADRWVYYKSGAMVHDINRSSDVPTVAQAGRAFDSSMLIDCQTADVSIGASDLAVIQQRIEGYNWLPLAQKIITLSFWVKSTKTGIYCVSIGNGSPYDKTIVKEYIINQSDTWEYKTLTFAASPSSGSWDFRNGIGARVNFTLAAGSNYQATPDSWQSGDQRATSNQVNSCDSVSNNFRLCGVQIERGNIATPFEQKLFQNELLLCQRYYEKSYDLGTPPGTIMSSSAPFWRPTEVDFHACFPFKVTKRSVPTVVTYSTATGAAGKLRDLDRSVDLTANGGGTTESVVDIYSASHVSGSLCSAAWTASSEL